ncbi:MAG: glycosyltransferase family 2 protein [Gemmatimonadota bacterium]|nr:glycosyltransferase family 2 protein [Gemmatimonadota bacterium]
MSDLPKISIIVPTYNEEHNIRTCLDAVFSQDYPREKLEVMVVDNRSEDRTVEILGDYDVRLIYNDIEKHGETSKMIGFQQCTGEFFIYLDADIEILGKNWLRNLLRPFSENEHMTGAFGRFVPKPSDSAIGRFLRYHPLELDPILQYFSVDIERTVVERKEGYTLCEFLYPRIPLVGICLYRVEYLKEALKGVRKFIDIDVPCLLSKAGHTRFAYVPYSGFYHINVKNLRDLLARRWRNLMTVYLPNEDIREYQYFDLSSLWDWLRIGAWVIYANLFVPELVRGLYKWARFKDYACLYQPVISIILTDFICFCFIWKKFLARDFKK